MRFSELALYFQKLEQTSSRNSMTEILAQLFNKASVEDIDKICYLTQGRVAPLFIALEFGMADKMVIKALSLASGKSADEVNKFFKKVGDLGKVAEELLADTKGAGSFFVQPAPRAYLSLKQKHSTRSTPKGGVRSALEKEDPHLLQKIPNVTDVFSILKEIASSSGPGSVERKTTLLADLLRKVDSLSARFIVRIPLAKMRLGFSDMTVLDALSYTICDDKSCRPEIEKAYNVRPDLGLIAKKIKEKGIKGIREIGPEAGTPILMARAERLSSGKEIIAKIGKCAIEPKLDGFRLQVHFSKNSELQIPYFKLENEKLFDEEQKHVILFTRNLEDVTHMYPDVVEGVVSQIKANEVIFEGEAIAYNPDTGEYLPFQETVQRKRKYDIEAMSKSVPLKLIVFDILYIDGENLIHKPFLERRKRLEEIFRNL
ncbi:MAG: hypothetical protein V1858_04760 [Candidatus Gottesmanbacteria bacterium]